MEFALFPGKIATIGAPVRKQDYTSSRDITLKKWREAGQPQVHPLTGPAGVRVSPTAQF